MIIAIAPNERRERLTAGWTNVSDDENRKTKERDRETEKRRKREREKGSGTGKGSHEKLVPGPISQALSPILWVADSPPPNVRPRSQKPDLGDGTSDKVTSTNARRRMFRPVHT